MSAQRIAVLYGGVTAEREISLLSGRAVIAGLEALGKDVLAVDLGDNMVSQICAIDADMVFIALHGGAGEDGTVQALLDLLGMPYTGTGVLGSALAMDKVRCKQLWRGIGLPTADFCVLDAATQWSVELDRLGGHVMVKPVREGSSVGMSQARTPEALERAYLLASQFDDEVMAETWVDGKEYSIAVLGDVCLPIIELIVDEEFYTYHAKYNSETTRYLCPAPMDSDLESSLKKLALDAFKSVGCKGWGRVDLMLDEQGQPWLLEVNTVPGMTSHSLVPMGAKQAGYDLPQLLQKILEEAEHG
jgi:D-alanine-D-alanine ligase